MKLLVFVLHKIEKLEDVLKSFNEQEIKGATIINSTGMAQTLAASDELVFRTLRQVLDLDRTENRTILVLLKEREVEVAIDAITRVVGDLSKPDTGILFTVPVDFVKGITSFE